jgi:type I restriction enzyme R subunit
VDALPNGIRKSEEAVAETIENNVRKLIINESPVDPDYYEKMSKLLDALIEQRRKGVIDYKKYLDEIAALTKLATTPGGRPDEYPASLDTPAKRSLFNNLGKDAALAMAVDHAVDESIQDGWRENGMKIRRVRVAIRHVLSPYIPMGVDLQVRDIGSAQPSLDLETETDRILELVKQQNDY